jgi:hypothetical protein
MYELLWHKCIRQNVVAFSWTERILLCKKLVFEMKKLSEASVLRNFESFGCNYVRCNDGRKLLLEPSDIADAWVELLRTVNEVKQACVTNVTISMKCAWIRTTILKVAIRQVKSQAAWMVSVCKASSCLAESADGGYVLEGKLIFPSNTKYWWQWFPRGYEHWIIRKFEEKFLLYLALGSDTVIFNANIILLCLRILQMQVAKELTLQLGCKPQPSHTQPTDRCKIFASGDNIWAKTVRSTNCVPLK